MESVPYFLALLYFLSYPSCFLAQVTDVFSIKDFDKALEKMKSKSACKVALKP